MKVFYKTKKGDDNTIFISLFLCQILGMVYPTLEPRVS